MVINIKDLVLTKGYFTGSEGFSELVFLNEGSFELKNESMEFKTSNNEDIFIEYDIYVNGYIDDEGYAVIGDEEIIINKIFVGEDRVLLNNLDGITNAIKSEIY